MNERFPISLTRPRWIPWVLAAILLVRFLLALLPGFPPDLNTYKIWALVAGVRGIQTVYDTPASNPDPASGRTIDDIDARYDYPPLYAYLLAPAGRIAAWADPEIGLHLTSSRLFTVLVKIPPLLFDLLTALLLAWMVSRMRLWGPREIWAGWAPALVYLLHPGVLFDSAYWGQPDVVHVFFVLLSLTLVLERRPAAGWVAAALACLMKPLAAPFVLWIALATLLRSGWRGLLRGGVAGLATGLVVLSPFLLTGRGGIVLGRLVGDVDLMPYTTVNGHNFWWLFSPWGDAHRSILGIVTPTQFGILLFAAVMAWFGVRVWRLERMRPDAADDAWVLGAAGVAFTFFYFMTHMHENHLFALIPLSILLAGRGRMWRWFAAGVALVTLVNMATHDWAVGRALGLTAGSASSIVRPDTGRPIPSRELAVATVNASLVTALYLFYVVGGIRRASLNRLK